MAVLYRSEVGKDIELPCGKVVVFTRFSVNDSPMPARVLVYRNREDYERGYQDDGEGVWFSTATGSRSRHYWVAAEIKALREKVTSLEGEIYSELKRQDRAEYGF